MTDSDHQTDSATDEISSRLMVVLLLVSALGFSAHRLRPMIQRLGWMAGLVSYAVGGLMVIAVFPIVHSLTLSSFGITEKEYKRRSVFIAFASLVLSFGAVGAGVALGWLVDPEFTKEG